MLKSTTAVMVAAAIAAAFTILFAPAAPVDAGPLAKPAETALKACTQRAWPYLNCVGTDSAIRASAWYGRAAGPIRRSFAASTDGARRGVDSTCRQSGNRLAVRMRSSETQPDATDAGGIMTAEATSCADICSFSLGLLRHLPAAAQIAPSAAEIAAYRGLHAAAAKGDVAEIEQLIKAGETIEAPGLPPAARRCTSRPS